MSKKVEGHGYNGLDQMEEDFNQMVENCMTYNSKDTKYYRAAVKIRDQVLHTARIRTTPHRTGFGPDEWFYSAVMVLLGSCPGGEYS